MNRQSHHRQLIITGIVVLIATAIVTPVELRARQRPTVADFTPPLTDYEAQAVVAAARAAGQGEQQSAPEAAPLPAVQNMYFASSGFHISDRTGFLSFWRRNGGELIFGYPISGELIEDGRIVQYFERARFEYHPEHLGTEYQVMLSLLGNEITQGHDFPDGQPMQGRVYFPETRQTLGGKFLRFWQKRGGLRVFGYPISEPFEEISPIDGQVRVTQYFERARFEYHPEQLPAFYHRMEQANGIILSGLYEVQLTDLGRQAMQSRGYTPQTVGPMPGVPVWSHKLFERRIEVNLTKQMLTAFEGDVPIYRAPVATGRDGFNTPSGSFAIYHKLPRQTMTGSAGGESWYVPDVPWVQYIVGGVALHGTYWHDAWGTGVRMSHGCINLNIDDAEWLYHWADIGTRVDVVY